MASLIERGVEEQNAPRALAGLMGLSSVKLSSTRQAELVFTGKRCRKASGKPTAKWWTWCSMRSKRLSRMLILVPAVLLRSFWEFGLGVLVPVTA
jgi:hypothetical protein